MVGTIVTLVLALIGSIAAFFFQKNKTEDVEAQNDNLKTNDEVAGFTQDIIDNEKQIKGNENDEEQINDQLKKIEVLKSGVGSLIDFFNKRK